MSTFAPYVRSLGLWTIALALFFLLLGGAGPGTQDVGILHKLPAVLGFALALATFPAGLAMSGSLLSRGVAWRGVGLLAATSLVLSLLMFLNATMWAPSSLAASGVRDSLDVSPPPSHQASATLRAAAERAYSEAQAAGPGRVADWLPVNKAGWELERRLAHSSLPFFLTWIGVFSAHWTRRLRRGDLRLAMHWGIGLFLVVSLYLAGENSYELIVLRAGGPVFFAAWFIAFVPAALFGTLGWVTALHVLGSEPADG